MVVYLPFRLQVLLLHARVKVQRPAELMEAALALTNCFVQLVHLAAAICVALH